MGPSASLLWTGSPRSPISRPGGGLRHDFDERETHPSHPHPRRALARRRGLRDAELLGRAGAADDPARAAHDRDGHRLAAHRLPAVGLCRHRDHWPAGRHVRQGAAAALHARRARRRHAAGGRLELPDRDHHRPLHPGCERRHLPARLRHRPRRVPAREGRRQHRPALGDSRRGAGIGIVLSGVIVEHLNYHWLFWIPLLATIIAAVATWRFIPESPVRAPGRINWLAAALMTAGISIVLLAISETTTWGWGSSKTLGLLLAGFAVSALWIAVEVRSKNPLIDMAMMRIRGVWTTNLAAFLLGAGMYASFIVFPQFAQLPKSTGFGFGASVVVSGLYLLPSTIFMTILGLYAGRISARFGSRRALLTGTAFTTASFALLALAHSQPFEFLIAAALLGIGIGLAFAALGNLIVQAVSPQQTGVASGMNTVMRTLGGALGGQLSASFIAAHILNGEPAVTGFTETFLMATGFLLVCFCAGLLVPKERPYETPAEGEYSAPAVATPETASV